MNQKSSVSRDELPRTLWWIVLAAFAVRVAAIFAFKTYGLAQDANHYWFGYETGSIAGSLASGHGFSSPFGQLSGPTAWIAPLYPLMVAAAFRVFGLFSTASAIVVFAINSLASAITCIWIYKISARTFNARTGIVAGLIWALVPFYWRWPITWVWETAFAALFLSIIFWLTLLGPSSTRDWLRLGLVWGISALVSPSILGFLPASLLYPALRQARKQTLWRGPLVAALMIVAVISPWMIRNYTVFGLPVFLRSNFWFEFRLSNFHLSTSEAWSGLHPARNERQFQRYKQMGEAAFIDDAKREGHEFVKRYPGEFASLVGKRIVSFWSGDELRFERTDDPYKPWMVLATSLLAFGGLWLALRQHREGAMLYLWLLLLYPIPYYLTYTNPRYRHAIEPLMVALSAYLLTQAFSALSNRKSLALSKAV